MRKIILFAVLFGLCSSASLIAQGFSDGRIAIAVPGLRILNSGISSENAMVYGEMLSTALSNEAVFDVIDRDSADAILEEYEYQLSIQADNGISDLKLEGARALLIGSIGLLYDKVVFTTRLVDVETMRVLFANNIYADKNKVDEVITTLAGRIRDRAFELLSSANLDNIEKLTKAKNWQEAKRLIDSYMRRENSDERARELFSQIIEGLAQDNYRQAKRYLKDRLFVEARSKIDEALALSVEPEFFELRERIQRQEELWLHKQRLAKNKRDLALQNMNTENLYMKDRYRNWLKEIDGAGAHVGTSFGMEVLYPDISARFDDWVPGIQAFWLKPYRKDTAKNYANWMWYAGGSISWEPYENTRSLFLQAYASPLLAETFKLGMVCLSMGLDGSAFMWYGDFGDKSLNWGLGAGSLWVLNVKIHETLSVYGSVKADFRWLPQEPGLSAPALLVGCGMSF